METTEGDTRGGIWICPNDECGEHNKDSDYRCRKCNKVKPYLSLTSRTEIDFPGKVCRIVLIGKTGNGKSSTGNTILDLTKMDPSERFTVSTKMKSATKTCYWRSGERFGVTLEVVDTPGFFDTDDDDVTITKEISKCLGLVSDGPHALLLVVRLDAKFTKEEVESVRQLKYLFGDDIMQHVLIVFTHGDWLKSSLDEFLAGCPDTLIEIMKEAGDRCIVFNNLEEPQGEKDKQVRQLLLKVRDMISSTGDLPFNSQLLARCEEVVLHNTAQLAHVISSGNVGEHHRKLIRAGLESRDKFEDVLNEVLDKQEEERRDAAKEKSILEASLRQVEQCQQQLEQAVLRERDERQKAEREGEKLKQDKKKVEQERDKLKKDKRDLEEKMKTMWKCHII